MGSGFFTGLVKAATAAQLPPPTTVHTAPSGQAEKIEHMFSAVGRPKALAYGRHVVGGNLIFQHEITSGGDAGKTVIFLAHGLGEWEGPEAVFVNGRLINHTNTAIYHFHPGTEGEAGTESDPAVRNQKICSFWPSEFAGQEKNFPRTVYSSFKLSPDPEAPGPGFVIRIVMKCRRVRIFDASGAQTDYRYSSNPADVYADLVVESWLKRGKGAIGDALTAEEKAYFDFGALATWRTDADATTPQGTKRAEAHPAFVDATDLLRASELALLLGQGYHVLYAGKLAPAMDKARSAGVALSADEILDGSFNRGVKNTREAANRLVMKLRRLNSGRGPGTIATIGTAVTGTGTDFKNRFQAGDTMQLLDGAEAGQVREVAAVASDTAMTLRSAFSADQSGRLYSNPALDFATGEVTVENPDHQDQVRRVVKREIDLHNLTREMAERRGKYLDAVTHQTTRLAAARVHHGVELTTLLPGRLITAPDDVDFDPARTRVWQVMELTVHPGIAERSGVQFEVGLQEYDAVVFGDTADAEPPLVPQNPGRAPAPVPDGPPTAVIGATPMSGDAPLEVQFNGENSTTVEGATVMHWRWSFGDGTTSTAKNPLKTFGAPGGYHRSVLLTIEDSRGRVNTAAVTITVNDGGTPPPGDAPVADIVAFPTQGAAPLNVAFDASGSTGSGLSYAWSFGDGSGDVGEFTAHRYQAFGVYFATLTVTDDEGRQASASVQITVSGFEF